MFSINNADTTENDPDVWGNSPWPARNAAPFSVLNSFMERANDVLDLVHTAQHFKNLESVAEIGGVGNKSLGGSRKKQESRWVKWGTRV